MNLTPTFAGFRRLLAGACLPVILAGVLPDASPAKDVTLELNELWRVNAALEQSPVFGHVADVVVDDAGRAYVLDTQRRQIEVFGPDGRHLDTIGRPGEGPGDIPKTSGMFLRDGHLGIVEQFPARIHLLSTDGISEGTVTILPPEDSRLNFLFKAAACDGGFIVEGEYASPKPITETFRYVALVQEDGTMVNRFFELPRTVDGKPRVDQLTLNRLDDRWGFGAGKLFAARDYDRYRVGAWKPDGNLSGTIEKSYEPHAWTQQERRNLEMYLRGNVARGELRLPDFHRVIEAIHVVDDRLLLVLTSRGARPEENSTMGRFDVFDMTLRELGTVTLRGEGLPLRDRFVFAGGRLFVVIESLPEHYDCFRELKRSVDPMTIICYETHLADVVGTH